MTVWDRDGAGTEAPSLVVGSENGFVWRWDGSTWETMAQGMSTQALLAWDPDGEGPDAPQLVAGGSFYVSGANPLRYVARWTGTGWQEIGGGTNRPVHAIAADSGGLLVGGDFTAAGASQHNHVARWTGTTWEPLGAGTSNTVRCFAVRDDDVFVGGDFVQAGGITASGLARWDGTTWSAVGSGLAASFDLPRVRALTWWDPDGDGATEARLVACGQFTSAGGVPALNIAQWDGTAWQGLGTGVPNFGSVVIEWDPDEDGPGMPELVCGGYFSSQNGIVTNGIGRWNGSEWRPLGTGFGATLNGNNPMSPSASAITLWDPDGAGPEGPQPVVGGTFHAAGEARANAVARWDRGAWRPLFSEETATTFEQVFATTVFEEKLIVAGSFYVRGASGIAYRAVSRWDGHAWQPIGGEVNQTVNSLLVWDSDGDGPEPPALIAAGRFTSIGGSPASLIARWDATAWQPLGPGLTGGTSPGVWALTAWDADGAGPEPAQLVAGGSFTTAGQTTVNRIARWDGTLWHPIGAGFGNGVNALTVWDHDGDESTPERLVAGGTFLDGVSVAGRYVAMWDGTMWQALGSGVSGSSASVSGLTTWDVDGPGPLPARLVAAGRFSLAGNSPANNIASWDGAAWTPVGVGTNGSVYSSLAWDPDGEGPELPMLVAAGAFLSLADGEPSSCVALYGCTPDCDAPALEGGQPGSITRCRGSTAEFSVTVSGTTPSIRWRRNGTWLSDGPTGTGSTIGGATTNMLVISGVTVSDAGLYDCHLVNVCGTVTSEPAMLSVCAADMDCNGRVEPADVAFAVARWYTAVQQGTLDGDYDGNGVVQPADIALFVGWWFGAITGGC